MEKDKDALVIISEAYEKMKEEGCATYREGKPNFAELSRRTGYSRKVVARLYSSGFKEMPHGNSGSKGSRVITPFLEDEAKGLLAAGVSNSSVVFDRLREKGYRGGLTTVKEFIRANKDLIPAGRQLVQRPQGKTRRYQSASGEMFQMDWGFADVEDSTGQQWRCACFALVCHHCGMRYAEFFPNARQENLFIGMLHGFGYMGIPKIILTDNMTSVSNRMDSAGVERREDVHPAIFCSQYSPSEWVTRMGASVKSESITDNFIYDSLLICFNDFNMRNYLAKQNLKKWC